MRKRQRRGSGGVSGLGDADDRFEIQNEASVRVLAEDLAPQRKHYIQGGDDCKWLTGLTVEHCLENCAKEVALSHVHPHGWRAEIGMPGGGLAGGSSGDRTRAQRGGGEPGGREGGAYRVDLNIYNRTVARRLYPSDGGEIVSTCIHNPRAYSDLSSASRSPAPSSRYTRIQF